MTQEESSETINLNNTTDFIAQLSSIFRTLENPDSELIDILETYILTEDPQNNAVPQAYSRIKELARYRIRHGENDE